MALSIDGWINGITASSIVIFGVVLGIFMIFPARKSKIKLLLILGLGYIFGGLLWLANFVDFIHILITGNNLDPKSILIFNILTWMWLPFGIISGLYVSTEFLFKEKRWYILSFISILSVGYEICLFFYPTDVLFFEYPKNPGVNLINEDFVFGTPTYIIMVILICSYLIINGIGLTIHGLKSTGIIRKKLLLLGLGFFIWSLFGIFEATGLYGFLLIPVRLGLIFALILEYFGIREEPEKEEKIKPQKELKVEGDLFRISKYRREDITEEEISISKEKQICLVCKNEISRESYLCPECKAFYCIKCSKALTNLENACWVCGTPIDETKPVKPFKKEGVKIEKSEK